MKRFGVTISLAAAIAVTAWFVWALVTDRAVAAWLDARSADGVQVEVGTQTITGFPTAFVTELRDLRVTDLTTGAVWRAQGLDLRQSAWDLGRVEARWPLRQSLELAGERVTLEAESLTSDLDVRPLAGFALDAATTRGAALTVSDTRGTQVGVGHILADVTRDPDTQATYDTRFEAEAVRLPPALVEALDPTGVLPATIPELRWSAVVRFDRPWDIRALEAERPQPVEIAIRQAVLRWGDLRFSSDGTLTVDAAGRVSGRLSVRAENWQAMLDLAVRAGMLSQGLAASAETALGFVAGLSGAPEDIDASLRLEDGFVFFGPLPIGEAPLLRLY